MRPDITKLDEARVAFLFQPNSSDPCDYFTRHRKDFAEPEKGLMLGVLEDALRCLNQHAHAKDARGDKLFREAEEWLLDESEDWIFSFSSICELLGLNRACIRKQAASWKQKPQLLWRVRAISRKDPAAALCTLSRSRRGDLRICSGRKEQGHGGKRSLSRET